MTENMKLALEKMNEAGLLFKEEWDRDGVNNPRSAGCYKAINAMRQVLSDEGGDERRDYYVFTRLIETISWFADYYGIRLPEALRIGGVR